MKKFRRILPVFSGCTMLSICFYWVYTKPFSTPRASEEEETNFSRWRDLIPKFPAKNQTIVFNNMVPKCGSRTTKELISKMAKKSHFQFRSTETYFLTHQQQVDLVRLSDRIQEPLVYHSYNYFVDFTRFGSEQPAYISLIREPFSRFVSRFYYERYKDYKDVHKNWTFNATSELKNQTFEACVLNNDSECHNKSRIIQMIQYFCGQDQRCREPSPWSLNQAKANVVQHYLVVGILSEYEDFLSVLEKLLPNFFAGILELYRNPGTVLEQRIVTTKTRNKRKPTPLAEKVMKERLKMEYDFYDFIKNRFHRLKHELGL